jgi:hypothetical protein
VADHLQDGVPTGFDIVTLIYYDDWALSPADRRSLLRGIRSIKTTDTVSANAKAASVNVSVRVVWCRAGGSQIGRAANFY